jgi:hypothetical protein
MTALHASTTASWKPLASIDLGYANVEIEGPPGDVIEKDIRAHRQKIALIQTAHETGFGAPKVYP